MKINTVKINQRSRASSSANKRLRKSGYLPGAISGKEIQAVSVSIKKDDFRNMLTTSGRNGVFKLELPDQDPYTVVIKEIQNDIISREILHVDFHKISLTEEIQTDVAIRFTGMESLEKKKLLLATSLDAVTVKCLPQNTPETIDIDVSNLEKGDTVKVGDLTLADGIIAQNNADDVIVVVTEPKIQVVEEDVEEADTSL
ncbi:large subunit ribosomal protein L25 [Alkalibaculum bacchi]|jgi:large subunit ribosomal protein L25|uniref:Large ribosomal subunit protein bL25 n=1 Tax=Alkalibaculum bacchi TaxID=645887 RepID=A0A366I5Y3_9FIRM|nr:50S ribosomal protein L25 [Alkalibaculum bacchi]RBP63816.1 large subunit ribosomal protein L25 [Alkalibaculum bacchi]